MAPPEVDPKANAEGSQTAIPQPPPRLMTYGTHNVNDVVTLIIVVVVPTCVRYSIHFPVFFTAGIVCGNKERGEFVHFLAHLTLSRCTRGDIVSVLGVGELSRPIAVCIRRL